MRRFILGLLLALGASAALAQPPVIVTGTSGYQATVNSSGQLVIDCAAGCYQTTQPVSGTVTVQQATASSLNATVVGAGSAGTANAGVVTVQGIASMTPVQVSQATASNLNATVVGAGSAGSASSGVETVQGIASMTPLLVTPSAPADPCFASLKSQADFESSTSGGSIVTAASSKKVYVCSITIVTSAAANVSIIEGTGASVCTGGSPTALYLNTGTTAANGASFAANSGLSHGSGNGTLFESNTANYNVCVIFTTTNSPTVNVHVGYVQQ